MIQLSINDFNLIKHESKLSEIRINNMTVYEKNGSYYRITLVKDLGGYIIECAESLDEANKNFFEDVEFFPNSINKNDLIDNIISFFTTQ